MRALAAAGGRGRAIAQARAGDAVFDACLRLMTILAPTLTQPMALDETLRERGHAVLDVAGLASLIGEAGLRELQGLARLWEDLPLDGHLRDGGSYRRRRHGCFVVTGERVEAVPHRAHWQPAVYNALHGGIERWFEPLDARMSEAAAWERLLVALGRRASALRGARPWFVEAHPFRIDTEGGIGRPTPEGAHRDGVDLVAVLLVARHGVKGGETRVFEARGARGLRFTLSEPWTLLLLDDARVIHETTPIQPLAPDVRGWRDTLVLTYRTGGFQSP